MSEPVRSVADVHNVALSDDCTLDVWLTLEDGSIASVSLDVADLLHRAHVIEDGSG